MVAEDLSHTPSNASIAEKRQRCLLPYFTLSGLLFKLPCSLTFFNVCCMSYPPKFSTVKSDVLGNIAETLVERSDHGAEGGSGVVLNKPDAEVDDIAV